MVRLLSWAGLRSSELISIDVSGVDFERKKVRVKAKRRCDPEDVNIPTETRNAIREWMTVRGESEGPLFTAFNGRSRPTDRRITYRGLYDMVGRLGQSVGVRCRPHGLRHTGITECLKLNNGNIVKGMEFSRHRDPRTLLAYLDNMREPGRSMVELVEAGFPE